jgi:CRP-like cAMP-binding protein
MGTGTIGIDTPHSRTDRVRSARTGRSVQRGWAPPLGEVCMQTSMYPSLRVRDPVAWQSLRAAGVTRRLPRGGELTEEVDQCSVVVLVESGALKEVGVAENGQTAVLAVRRAGEVIGELATSGGRPRAASLVAIEQSVIVTVHASRLLQVLRRRPRTALALMQSAVARINESDRRRVEYVSYPMPERIRLVLRDLARHFTPEGPAEPAEPADAYPVAVIPLAQQDVASLAGASREATARVLRRLREEGTVETGRSRIRVLRPDRLIESG